MKIKIGHAGILGLLLSAIGLTILFIKIYMLNYPLSPGVTTAVWDFEIYIEFNGRNRPARIEAYIPAMDTERNFSEEQFYNGSFGLGLLTEQDTQNRKAVWTYRYPSDRKVLRYKVQTLGETRSTPLPLEFRESIPNPIPFEADEIKRQAFIVWAGALRQRSADDRSYADLAIKAALENTSSGELYADELAVLLGEKPGIVGRLELARHALQSQRIPARIVNGVYLGEASRREEIKHWIEYHIEGQDFRYFPGGTPGRFFTIWYGSDDIVRTSGVDNVDAQIALQKRQSDAIEIARSAEGRIGAMGRALGFYGLPLTTQLVYQVLLTIPVGITILVFLRQFVGVKTIGTFMPVLIGIAFRETALLNGILLFSLLTALGLALRFYLERLHLLLVPRLAVVVIFVIMMMAAITNLMSETNQAIGLSISLFPIVVLTMTIERMSIVWEETAPSDAIKQGAGSLLVASITYLAMTNDQVEYMIYQFPELLLVMMGLCVLMGRYTGLRLSELWRFRVLEN